MAAPKDKPLPIPHNFDMLYPGRFLKAGTLDGKRVTLTITSITLERLEGEKGLETKAIMAFEGKDMQLVLAKTNAICVRAMFGPTLALWIGKRITLTEDKVEIAGPMFGQPCIRIYGSPDLKEDMIISIKLPKRKAFQRTLYKVKGRSDQGAPAEPSTPPPSPPPGDSDQGDLPGLGPDTLGEP